MGNVSKRNNPTTEQTTAEGPNGSSMQRETPAPGGVLQLAPTEICILVH